MSRTDNPGNAVNEMMDQARDKASDVSGQVRDIGNKVRDAASDTYGKVSDQAKTYMDQGRHKAEEWEQSMEDWVQSKPLQAVLIAAGVGLLLGLLWKRH